MSKFLILSLSRSGSTWLRDSLDSHPEITCYGELLIRKDGVPGSLRDEIGVGSGFSSWERRHADYRNYLSGIIERSPETPHFGFKLMIAQHEEALRGLMGEGWKVIYLVRENELATYASHLKARSNGQGPIRFDPEEFGKFHKRRANRRQTAEHLFAEYGVDPLRVRYLEMFEDEAHKNILRFIGADLSATLTTTQTKRSGYDIVNRFANPEAVTRYLHDHGLEHWATERPTMEAV